MRPTLSLKTLLRTPVKTLLTLILLGAATAAFFSRAAEYAVTVREMNSAARQYRGIGAVELEPAVPKSQNVPYYIYADPRLAGMYNLGGYYAEYTIRYKPLTREQVEAIAALPYVSSVSTRYMTAGISKDIFRIKDVSQSYYVQGFYDYTTRHVVEGTLDIVLQGENPGTSFSMLKFKDIKFLTEVPSPFYPSTRGYTIAINYANTPEGFERGIFSLDSNAANANPPDGMYIPEYIDNMTLGSRYVLVIHDSYGGTKVDTMFDRTTRLGDFSSDSWWNPMQYIDGEPENYLETEKFTPLRELIEITDADKHTLDMVYTDDMNAIMRFAQSEMAIIEGRALTREDTESSLRVCVVSKELADTYGFGVGDMITIGLGTSLFEQYKSLGAVAMTRERYSPAEQTETLEIVGIYADMDDLNLQKDKPHWCYSVNTVFVPKSLLPVEADAQHLFSPAEVSFTIDNAWDIEAFLTETAPVFEEMGMTLIFDDAGWPAITQAFRETEKLAVISVAVFSAAVIAATGFTVYLFIARKRKEYAIMRALGTSHRASAMALVFPLMVVAVVAVLAGSGAAWAYTSGSIARNEALLALGEASVNTAIPAGIVIGCVLGQLLLTMLLAAVMLRHIGRLPPLTLLHGGGTDAKRKPETRDKTRNEHIEAVKLRAPEARVAGVSAQMSEQAEKSRSVRFVCRYVLQHIRRSALKSAFSCLLAALLLIAVAQLALMRRSNADLIANTVITANFGGRVVLSTAYSINNNSMVTDPYYEVSDSAGLNYVMGKLVITNNIARYTGEEPDIEFMDGYDMSCFDNPGDAVIAGRAYMEANGLALGDTIAITPWMILQYWQMEHFGRHNEKNPDAPISISQMLEMYRDELVRGVSYATHIYTIVGAVTTPSGTHDDVVFTPGAADALFKTDVLEYTLADNSRADEFREFGEQVARFGGGIDFVMDESALENPRNTLRLLDALYPGALAVALLIGGFLCCLTILQSSKEAAIMRILGTTKRKTRAALVLEQTLLGIVGLLIGVCAMLIYKGRALAAVSERAALFAALYLAVTFICAMSCSAIVTRRSALELLQTKE